MNYSYSLSNARLSALLFLDLRFLGGREGRVAMADTSFSLLFSLLILGTGRECECAELRGGEALRTGKLELYQEALGMESRGFLGIESLFCTVLSLGTVFLGSTRWDWLGLGSWIQWRRLSCNGEVTYLMVTSSQFTEKTLQVYRNK